MNIKYLFVALMWLCSVLDASAKSPNFVFILADDQAWNGTSVPMMAGKDFSASRLFQTPNLQRLAAQGAVFSQAYSAHPKCECSRAAILMGRTTSSLNATEKNARPWNAPPSESLANTLKRADGKYRAAHLGKWQWYQTPESMGYDVSDGITENETGNARDPSDPKLSFSLTNRAGDFMAQQVKTGHPFFLQLSYYAVHPEAQALPSTVSKYEGKIGNGAPRNPGSGATPKGGGRGDRAVMAAMTEDLDTCVGNLLKKLEELQIAENTFVIYMSDNGGRTEILKGGKGNLGEGGLRVPLIVRGPGVRGGTYCNEPAISYDLLPTVLELAAPGFALPKGIEGGSWKSILMAGGIGKIKRPIARFVFHQPVEVDHPQSAIRKGDLKLLYYWDTREAQLFDLLHDLSETHDLAKEKPELTAQLQAELKDHIRAGLGQASYAALERGQVIPRAGDERPPRKRPPNP